jgi:peptide-methionine (S)-S-oxide reductase
MTNVQEIYFGAGCFWCVEAVFQQLRGVLDVKPGYMGGHEWNPTYKTVCSGTTGHAEVVMVRYDEKEISIENLLKVFWTSHDPTTLNRQGADKGTQYRSAIYYTTQDQRLAIDASLDEAKTIWPDPIVTEIKAAETFYLAENYHHNYFDNHGDQPYCAYIIQPKVLKVKKNFTDWVKS